MLPNSVYSLMCKSPRFAVILAVATLLSQCSSPRFSGEAETARYSAAPPPGAPESESRAAAKSRPGLGTELGHELHDPSSVASFYRKAASSPDAVGTFHYNDKEGAELMSKLEGDSVRQSSGTFELIPGKLRVAVMDGSWGGGTALNHYRAGQGIYVIGTPGHSYSIKLENRTSSRMEVVVSVDGLDLLDGQPASVKKSGYIIPAKSSVVIKGMRVNGKLFSLKFGSVSQSRASKAFGEKGARNVGVIGVACYEEDDQARRRVQVQENYVRQGARAFAN